MADKRPKTQRPWYKRLLRGFFVFLFVLLFLLIAIVLLIQTRPIQNILRGKAVSYLQGKLHTRVKIGRIYIGFPKNIVVEDLFFEDQQHDTLLAVEKLSVDLSMLKLFHSEVYINEVSLRDATVKIRRQLPDTAFNFQFIINAFSSSKSKPTTEKDNGSKKFTIKDISLDNFRVLYGDVVTGIDLDASLKLLRIQVSDLDFKNSFFQIPSIRIDRLHGHLYQGNPLAANSANAGGSGPSPKLLLHMITLEDIALDYRNYSHAFFGMFTVGTLKVNARTLDIGQRLVSVDKLQLARAAVSIRLGKTGSAKPQFNSAKTGPSDTSSWRIIAGQVTLDQDNFALDDENVPKQRSGMDYAHLHGQGISLHVNDFLFSADSIAGHVSEAMLTEQSGFALKALQGDFLYGRKQAYIRHLLLKTPGTQIQRSIVLGFPSLDAVRKNIGLLMVDLDMPNCQILVRDILTFAPWLDSLAFFKDPSAVFKINARIAGAIANLNIGQFQAAAFQDTKVDLSGRVQGLPDMNLLKAKLTIREISGSRHDLFQLMPAKDLPQNLGIPVRFGVNGAIEGTTRNLLTHLALNTTSGSITLQGNLYQINEPKKMGYHVTLTTRNLDLGYILKDDSNYGPIAMEFKIDGTRTDPKLANAKISGSIHSAVYKKYPYRDASIAATLANEQLNLNIAVRDPNAELSLEGTADLSTKYPAIHISVLIDSLKPKALHLTSADIAYQGTIKADFPVTDPDHLKGELLVENSLFVRDGQRITLDTIRVLAGQSDTGQFIQLSAGVVQAGIEGKYELSEMGNIYGSLIDPYFSFHGKRNLAKVQPYHFGIYLRVQNGPLIKTLAPTLERLDPITFQSRFDSEKGWNADFVAPLIYYGDSRIQNLQWHARSQPQVLQIHASLQQYRSGDRIALYNTTLDAKLAHNSIDFAVNVQDKSAKDKYHVGGLLQAGDSANYRLSLSPDKLVLNYDKWSISRDNLIEYSASRWTAWDFNLNKGNEELAINTLSNQPDPPLEVSFNKFLLSTLTGFAGTDTLLANGELNGKIDVKDLSTKPLFTSDLTIKNLSVHKDTVGNISVKLNNSGNNSFSASVNISGRGNDVMLTGNYYLKADNGNQFDFTLNMRNLNLATLVGFSGGALRTASGSAMGQFTLKGTIDRPDINGSIAFRQAVLIPRALNSYFFVDQQTIQVQNDGISFNNFTVLDSTKNKLVLDGKARTSNFRHYDFDLRLNAQKFQALNSTKHDNKLFYGQLFLNARLSIKGTEQQPVVEGDLRINGKTRFTIVLPQDEPGVQERQGIVEFVNMKYPQRDSLLKPGYDSITTATLRGLDISTNIIVDSTAELTLVIDPSNGDRLVAKGNATLTGGVDPSGKISLSGTFQISDGSYDLAFSLLHKQFKIQNGSTITWTGEPTRGNLDVNAIYTIYTSPIDLVSDQLTQTASDRNNYLQKLPFDVHLKMSGQLLKPVITFDVVLPEEKAYSVSKDVTTTVEARLQLMRQDQGEVSRQVFALLLLGRFVGEDPFQSEGPGFNAESIARASVSKIFTQQLNKLASSLVRGVDINFDVQSTDDYTTGQLQNRTDLNVSVSKQLLNDRLRVTVGSNFELEGPANVNANQQSNNLAGNIAMDYKLSKDGRYLLRAYRRNDFDDVVEGYVIETGIGFIITINYNYFSEIFSKKKKTQKTNEPTPNSSDAGKTN